MADPSLPLPVPTTAEPPSQAELEDRLRFETFLSGLAARFLNLAAEAVEAEIEPALESLAEVLELDRCSLSMFTEDTRGLPVRHSFARGGIPRPERVDMATLLPWYTQQLRDGRTLVLPRLPAGLPPEALAEREYVAHTGIKSHVALPLRAGGRIQGALAVALFREHRDWSPAFVSRLELLAGVIASALYRRNTEARLRELQARLEAENVLLKQEVRRSHGFDEIVGTSRALAQMLGQVEQVAPTDTPVLLLGETGTGKELVARALHDRSPRRERPLVTLSCANLPAALVESELFGYEKGAFTGALQRTLGRFEVAEGGTIFLDEIGELPLEVQAKLLRVLQTGEFERLGSTKTVTVDARVVAATNRDLEREVREGRFRADLYYRLNVFPIGLPALRERAEDVPLLVWHFVTRKQAKLGRTVKRVPEGLMRAFAAYRWPGNVRELENLVERALIMTRGATLADPGLLEAEAAPSAATRLADVERAHIRAVLDECGWKLSGRGNAADRLGLNRSTLQSRMKKLGIARPGNGRGAARIRASGY